MNNEQRELLKNTIAKVEACHETCTKMQEEEQEKYDNLSEGLQQTENGESLAVAAGILENAADDLENAASLLKDL